MARHYTSIMSYLFGRFANIAYPAPIQNVINSTYVRLMGLDMSEFALVTSYQTLNRLFTRELKEPRAIDSNPKSVISPCDALITDFGTIENGQAYQIKGMAYDTANLLGEYYLDEVKSLEGGEYANFYLSPRDYHRYHIPMDLSVETLTHIPGKLFPVNMPLLKGKLNLFIENERVILATRDFRGKRHFIILVGALNVGKMVVTFEKRLKTNISNSEVSHFEYDEPITLKKGELLGWFEMGSTIVMLSEKDSLSYNLNINQKVKFSDVIATFKE